MINCGMAMNDVLVRGDITGPSSMRKSLLHFTSGIYISFFVFLIRRIYLQFYCYQDVRYLMLLSAFYNLVTKHRSRNNIPEISHLECWDDKMFKWPCLHHMFSVFISQHLYYDKHTNCMASTSHVIR